ncbi:polarity establishment/cellular polarization [Neurospora sp. IMI 360204]|nr:polarity establishment/cellular polarization [Neurospora sp. IMI 360204]
MDTSSEVHYETPSDSISRLKPKGRLYLVLLLESTSPSAPKSPPIARIGEPFSFVFSKSTFTSTSAVTYSLTNSPRWLSIGSDARKLYGTPKKTDVGSGDVVDVPVGLVATDETGSTTLDITLIVSRKAGPKLDIPLNQQIPGFGFFSNPYTILSPPRNQFSFVLDPKTFSASSDKPLTYYAVMSDNTPLPAWISFDAGRLALSGQTPSFEALIDPPQTFEFQLLATDTPGFAGASLRFNIVVGNHRVTADQTTVVINTTAGEPFSYGGLRESIEVDGQLMASGDGLIVASTFNIPSWLTLEMDSLRIAGTPPMAAKSTNFTIALEDRFADRFNLTVMVQVSGNQAQASGMLKEELPVIQAQAGEHISFDLAPYLENPDGTEIAIDDDASPSWIHVREGTIFGDVPNSSKDSIVSATIRLTSKASGASESVLLSVHMLAESRDTADTTDAASGPGSTSTGDSGGTKPSRKHAPTPVGLILLVTILPGLLLLGALMSMLVCCLGRRREAKRPKLSTRDISGPLPGTFTINVTGPDG